MPGVSPTLPIAQHLSESVACSSVTLPPAPILQLSLLDQLKAVIDSLPVEVPYGIDSNDLAIFAGSPHAHIQQDDKAWEKVKKEHDLFPFLEGVGGGGGSARPYPNKRSSCTRIFFYTPLGLTSCIFHPSQQFKNLNN